MFNAGSNKTEASCRQRKALAFYSAYALSRKDKEAFKIVVVMFEYGRIPVMLIQENILLAGPEQALLCYYGRLGPFGKQNLPALQIPGVVSGYKFPERFFVRPEFVTLFVKTFVLVKPFQIREYGLYSSIEAHFRIIARISKKVNKIEQF
jgi:hypothetical protein